MTVVLRVAFTLREVIQKASQLLPVTDRARSPSFWTHVGHHYSVCWPSNCVNARLQAVLSILIGLLPLFIKGVQNRSVLGLFRKGYYNEMSLALMVVFWVCAHQAYNIKPMFIIVQIRLMCSKESISVPCLCQIVVKGVVPPKMKILILNLFDLFSSTEHKIRYFEECVRWYPFS